MPTTPRTAVAPVPSSGRGHPEVADPQVRPAAAGGLEQQVGRLEVAVHQAGGVHRAETLEQLVEQAQREGRRERGAVLGEEVGQRPAPHQLEGEPDDLGAAHDVAEPPGRRGHVRVVDPHGLLAHEPGQVRALVAAQQLDGDVAVLAQVEGPPHRPHAADAQQVEAEVAAGEHVRRGGGHGTAR